MRIGIIGAGHIGGALARHFVNAGHEVAISNSRGPETLAGLVKQLGAGAPAMTAAGAARFGDIGDGRPAGDGERLGIPVSGDDEQAKRTVAELIDQIGFDPVDAGTLAEGGRTGRRS